MDEVAAAGGGARPMKSGEGLRRVRSSPRRGKKGEGRSASLTTRFTRADEAPARLTTRGSVGRLRRRRAGSCGTGKGKRRGGEAPPGPYARDGVVEV